MVVRKKKKYRKYRGHRTYGYGSHKKRRGGGSRGGRGRAGLHKHKWSYTVKYEPEHFGKRGFKRPREVVRKPKTINLKELDEMVEQLVKERKVKREGKVLKVNLKDLGYDKLLGRGKISKPLVVEAKYFSKLAIKKLEEAGGKAVVVE